MVHDKLHIKVLQKFALLINNNISWRGKKRKQCFLLTARKENWINTVRWIIHVVNNQTCSAASSHRWVKEQKIAETDAIKEVTGQVIASHHWDERLWATNASHELYCNDIKLYQRDRMKVYGNFCNSDKNEIESLTLFQYLKPVWLSLSHMLFYTAWLKEIFLNVKNIFHLNVQMPVWIKAKCIL